MTLDENTRSTLLDWTLDLSVVELDILNTEKLSLFSHVVSSVIQLDNTTYLVHPSHYLRRKGPESQRCIIDHVNE